jgi:protein TonB
MENSERLDKLIRDNADSWQAYQQRHPELFVVHDKVDQMPSFPGGDSALLSYLANETTYPVICINKKIQGRVIVGFIVERNGSISSAKIVRSVDPALDKEALRVISSMPKWNPAKKNGVPVRVKFNLPIAFKL